MSAQSGMVLPNTCLIVAHVWCYAGLQMTQLSFNAALVERSAVAKALVEVPSPNPSRDIKPYPNNNNLTDS